MKEFPETKYYRSLIITDASEVVRYSFAAQSSISYLDLSVCEYSRSVKTVTTRDTLRKVAVPERRILYDFHLDEPSVSLASNPEHQMISVSKQMYTAGFCTNLLSYVKKSNDKLRVIHRFLKPIRLLKLNEWPEHRVVKGHFMNTLEEQQCKDFSILAECAQTFGSGLEFWLIWIATTEFLEDMLIATQRKRICLWRQTTTHPIFFFSSLHIPENLGFCLIEKMYILLKYGYGIKIINDKDYFLNMVLITLYRILHFRVSEDWLRTCLMCITLKHHNALRIGLNPGASETITDIIGCFWNTVTYPYYCRREIYSFREMIHDNHAGVEDFCEFYRKDVCRMSIDCFEVSQPRCLKHLSRICIRDTMNANFGLPHAVETLKLPTNLKHYLKLGIQ